MDWPTNLPLAGSFDKVEDVVGKPLLYPAGGQRADLEAGLGPGRLGHRHFREDPYRHARHCGQSNEIVGVAGFLYPGSRVDVMVTYTPPGGGRSGPVTQTVLQNVEVLTAGQTIEPDPQGKPADGQRGDLAGQSGGFAKAATGQLARRQFSLCCAAASIRRTLIFVPRSLDQLASDRAPAPPPVPGKKAPRRVARPPSRSTFWK